MTLPHRTTADLAAEAADWYVRLRSEDVTEMEAMRFRAWIARDPVRRKAFEAIDALWGDLGSIEQSPEVLRIHAEIAARRRRARRSPRAWQALAAAVLLASMGGMWFWQERGAPRYVTDIGEQRTVPLSDGSVVTLNTATEIRLHYAKDRRVIELVQGQANFEVARDPQRPFVVQAGHGEVRALGTAFDVYKHQDQVTVTLIEGKVAVSTDTALPGLPARLATPAEELHSLAQAPRQDAPKEIILAAGEQLTLSATVIDAPKPVDVPRVTAWRARQLDFRDTPLLEAITEANRYSHDQIVLRAPHLKDARISGSFEAGKNDLFAEGLQAYFGLEVRRSGQQIFLVSPPH